MVESLATESLRPFRAVFWGAATASAIFAACLGLSASALIRIFSYRRSYDFSSRIANTLWTFMQWLFERQHHAKITISGDDLPPDESALVISNHLSYSDFYLIHALASRKGMLGRCRYFAKNELKYIPVLGWTLILVHMILVSKNWMRDRKELERIFKPVLSLRLPIWLVTYVEGTRFTHRKAIASQKFCEARGKAQLQNVLYPRHKGFYTTVTEFRDSHIQYVYDFTLIYRRLRDGEAEVPDSDRGAVVEYTDLQRSRTNQYGTFGLEDTYLLQRPPTPYDTHSRSDLSTDYQFHVHVRRYPIALIPRTEESVTSWLEERFIEKDRIIESMKTKWIEAPELGPIKALD